MGRKPFFGKMQLRVLEAMKHIAKRKPVSPREILNHLRVTYPHENRELKHVHQTVRMLSSRGNIKTIFNEGHHSRFLFVTDKLIISDEFKKQSVKTALAAANEALNDTTVIVDDPSTVVMLTYLPPGDVNRRECKETTREFIADEYQAIIDSGCTDIKLWAPLKHKVKLILE